MSKEAAKREDLYQFVQTVKYMHARFEDKGSSNAILRILDICE